MKIVNGVFTGAMLTASLVVGGCAQDQAQGENETEVTEVTDERHLLASLDLSDTHKIEFWEYDSGDVLVHEDLHVDRDFIDGRPTLARMDTANAKLLDIYNNLAGARFSTAIATVLSDADVRTFERAQRSAATRSIEGKTELPVAIQGQIASSPGAQSPGATVRELPGGIAQAQSAVACPEPAWDWVNDVGWFKDNFCGNSSRACATEGNWWSYGWFRGPTNFKATGFAQSHCSAAHWLFKRRAYGGFPFYGISEATLANFDLAPRHLDTQHWTTTGDRAWFAKVSSKTGENRTALAVIHN